MSGNQYSTRLDDRDKRKIERYRDANNVSKAEALRHGVRELERDRSNETENEIRDWLIPLVRNWGVVLGTSIAVLFLSNAGVLPDFVELTLGIVLLPALAYSWIVS